MRFIFAILALLATSAHAEPQPYLQRPTVSFRALKGSDPKPVNPKVRYVGGYELVAKGTSELVGLSDLHVSPDGDRLKVEAVSDFGIMARFELTPDGKGDYLDSPLEIDPLLDPQGRRLTDKNEADAEGLTTDPVSGNRYISFEGHQRVITFPHDLLSGPGEVVPLGGLPVFPFNQGMEGVTYIQDPRGDALLIGVEAGGFWRCGLALNTCMEIHGPATPGFLYMMTSLAVVDYGDPRRDHDILGLYRYYDPITGPRNVLRLLHLEGDTLTVVSDLVKITPPLPVDNFEGVASVKTATGYRIFLVSDSVKADGRSKLLIFDWMP
ncbi:esterase-like activity of phytase family protein [Asticcacaulis taihuensis]|uniref:esterase-like activity of phytase family protein n=1 Tax=Asticcacaulis taihuensis TaxID=260084 RepID=UPI0026F26FEA|nr:esterase-like activity of phytase family protein [Asticcacaulis taihuensis]